MNPSTQHTFTSHDGANLVYRHWPAGNSSGKTLLLFHRGHEHSGRWQETVERMNLTDVDVFAWDQRGHGDSPGERGAAESLMQIVRDADAWSRHLQTAHGVKLDNTVVMAHSVGGVIAAAWVHDFAPPIRGLVLATPAFRVRLYVPLAVMFLRIKQKLLGPSYVKSYVKAHMVTRDREQAAAYKADPAIFRQIAVNILLDLHDTATRLLADAGAITVPTLIMVAGKDWVVKIPPQQQFLDRLSSRVKQLEVYPDLQHAVFHEVRRGDVIERAKQFSTECFQREAQVDLTSADYSGYTRSEFDRLHLPESPKWKISRAMMRLFGGLSDGIKLGRETGFDSGATLDYVYENKPRGKTILGRMIDRSYLNAIGWRGIRIRGRHVRDTLRTAIHTLHSEGKPIHILDVAAGPGRYVLETIAAMTDIPISALLRDYKPLNIELAQKIIGDLKLPNVAAEFGDAFDRESLSSLNPKPTIAIISGLFELIPDNERPRRTLAGLADAIAPGGYLLYTGQPWHPQVEMIARTLRNREGEPWIMRRRTTQEMDQLVAAAGFEKLSMQIDDWGIFTVSLARRI